MAVTVRFTRRAHWPTPRPSRRRPRHLRPVHSSRRSSGRERWSTRMNSRRTW